MLKPQFIIPPRLEPYVNCFMMGESQDSKGHYKLPLYADGYPGIMFQQAENGFYLFPRGKKLSELFLYGQTLDPISIEAKGTFKYIVFQLYPFASKYLLNVDPRKLNDDCYDLLQLTHVDVATFYKRLEATEDWQKRVDIISELMIDLIESHPDHPDDHIQQAISVILENNGAVSMKEVRDQVFLTERTFERKFMSQVGLTPKQFAKIIQFQTSLNQLTEANYRKLTEVGIDSGFADQSHFIRTFKKYTGQTPSFYLKHMKVG